jgi:hypothetical protein
MRTAGQTQNLQRPVGEMTRQNESRYKNGGLADSELSNVSASVSELVFEFKGENGQNSKFQGSTQRSSATFGEDITNSSAQKKFAEKSKEPTSSFNLVPIDYSSQQVAPSSIRGNAEPSGPLFKDSAEASEPKVKSAS